jgi:hypothetical protein
LLHGFLLRKQGSSSEAEIVRRCASACKKNGIGVPAATSSVRVTIAAFPNMRASAETSGSTLRFRAPRRGSQRLSIMTHGHNRIIIMVIGDFAIGD